VLRNFSRMDEAEVKSVDLHEGIDSTLMILHNRIKDTSSHRGIEIIREYGDLPLLECYAGQLNQVFMNVLSNAIDALSERDSQRSPQEIKQNPSTITIQTRKLDPRQVQISIADNGPGMPEPVRQRLFEPFFTTKPIGKGTGLGLSISYQVIVEKHLGQLECISALGQGAEFVITLPLATKRT
jgi:two-component system NtrC family sensor kinase